MNAGQLSCTAKVRDLERGHREAPEVAWKGPVRWDSRLGEVAIPLGPERRFVPGQVEGIDHGATLPTVVTRGLEPHPWIRSARNVT